jgi:DNA-binding NarL/FixJ family response regulator
MAGSADKKPAGTRHAPPFTILVMDDHPIVRHGLRQLLNDEPDLDASLEAASVAEALTLIRGHGPDLVIADLSLEGNNGLDLVKQIRKSHGRTAVLVLSMHDEALYAERALRAGASGYVMKQEPPERVVEAVRTVLRGELFVSPRVASRLMRSALAHAARRDGGDIESLSDRELDVFEGIGRGLSAAEIAARLSISVKTVESHRSHIKRKLRLPAAAALVHHAVRWVEHGAT